MRCGSGFWTTMNDSTERGSATASALRYLSCLRAQDIVVLQGSPLLGAAFAIHQFGLRATLPLVTLLIANLLLVTHIFLLNDWSGLNADLANPHKAASVFTARGVERREMAALTIAVLVLSLLLFARLGTVTLGLALGIATLSALYSLPQFDWKGSPLLNSAAHLAGGVLHFLLGYSLGGRLDARGIAMGSFFALVFAAGHLTQEIRDHDGDASHGTRTNAVAFGIAPTFIASLVLFALAHLVLLVLALSGLLPRPLALVPLLFAVQLFWSLEAQRAGLTYAVVCRLQSRYRVLYALIGVLMVGLIVLVRR